MRTLTFTLILGAALAVGAIGLNNPGFVVAQPASANQKAAGWEYMVLTVGEVDQVTGDSRLVSAPDQSKISAAFPGGTTYRLGSVNRQIYFSTLMPTLDSLGAQGWELVSTIGALNGDQQLTFKRPIW